MSVLEFSLFFFWVRFPRPLICISIFRFILCVVKFHLFKSKLHWQNHGEDHHWSTCLSCHWVNGSLAHLSGHCGFIIIMETSFLCPPLLNLLFPVFQVSLFPRSLPHFSGNKVNGIVGRIMLLPADDHMLIIYKWDVTQTYTRRKSCHLWQHGPRGHYPEWGNSDWEGQILHGTTYM